MRKRVRGFCYGLALAACFSIATPVGAARMQQPAAGDEDKVYKAAEVDEKAAIKRRPPVETIPAGCANADGRVRLRVVLRKSGEVTDVTVVRSSGCPDFDEGALAAVRRISFTPAKKAGRPVSQSALFEYSYRIG